MIQIYKFNVIKGILPRLIPLFLQQEGWSAVTGDGRLFTPNDCQPSGRLPVPLLNIVQNWFVPGNSEQVSVVIDHPNWNIHFTADSTLHGLLSKHSSTDKIIKDLQEDLIKQQQETLSKDYMQVQGNILVPKLGKLFAKCWELGYDPYVVIEHQAYKHNERLFLIDQHNHGLEHNKATTNIIHDTKGIILTFGSLGRSPHITNPREFQLKSFHALNSHGRLVFTLDEYKTFTVYDNEIKKVFFEDSFDICT